MKRHILLVLALCVGLGARAQLFTPESTSGAIFGALIGAGIGDSHHHQAGAGAAIGAGAGFLLGAAAHSANQDAAYYNGYGYYGPGPQPYYAPSYAPVYAPTITPSIAFYSSRGPWCGWHGHSGVGFSVGVGFGPTYLYRPPPPAYYYPATVVTQQRVAVPAPQQVTIVNNYYNSAPSGSVNNLFGR
jgi:hypothetical protein